jgi:hypothetical protein
MKVDYIKVLHRGTVKVFELIETTDNSYVVDDPDNGQRHILCKLDTKIKARSRKEKRSQLPCKSSLDLLSKDSTDLVQ